MEAVALFSFTASEADEISFQKGDIIKVGNKTRLCLYDCSVSSHGVMEACGFILQVIEMEEDSSWLTAEIEGKRGFIPENYISLRPHT